MQNTPIYLTVNETARATGLTTCFIRKCIEDGTCPHIMCGNRYKINLPLFLSTLEKKCEAKND